MHENNSQDILKLRFLDPAEDPHVREHSYYSYWLYKVREAETISREMLESMVEYKQWSRVLGDVVLDMCERERISTPDARWLLEELPDASFGHLQHATYLALHND